MGGHDSVRCVSNLQPPAVPRNIPLTNGGFAAGLVTLMFGAAGTLFNVSKRAQNQMKVRLDVRSMPCTAY